MAMTNRQVINTLSRLYRIVEAGEKGFATAATNVHNRGIKVLFKSYAQQRAKYKLELLDELRKLGANFRPRSSIRGIIHRGRVAILAALNLDEDKREMGVVKEAVLGESFALRTYKSTADKELPPQTHAVVSRQYDEVCKVSDQVNLMRGKEGKRLVVGLFDTNDEAMLAVQSLGNADFPKEAIEIFPLEKNLELYEGKGTTVIETIISGAFGGALWGGLIGILAGFGVVQTTRIEWFGEFSVMGTWALVALFIMLMGSLVGAILGLFIGVGISEEDTYLYREIIEHQPVMIQTVVDESRANEASKIIERGWRESSTPDNRVPA